MHPQKEPKYEKVALENQKIELADELDRKIFNVLNQDGRATLKEIAKEVGTSIDTAKRRLERMKETGAIMKIIAIPNPEFFGYPLFGHVYIKFQNYTEEKAKKFEAYVKNHPQIMMNLHMVGEYDTYLVMFAKGTAGLQSLKNDMRQKFSDFIADWKEMVVADVGKYEEYKF